MHDCTTQICDQPTSRGRRLPRAGLVPGSIAHRSLVLPGWGNGCFRGEWIAREYIQVYAYRGWPTGFDWGGEELPQQCGAVIVNIRVGKAVIILKLHQTAMVCTSQVNPSHFSNFSCI